MVRLTAIIDYFNQHQQASLTSLCQHFQEDKSLLSAKINQLVLRGYLKSNETKKACQACPLQKGCQQECLFSLVR